MARGKRHETAYKRLELFLAYRADMGALIERSDMPETAKAEFEASLHCWGDCLIDMACDEAGEEAVEKARARWIRDRLGH